MEVEMPELSGKVIDSRTNGTNPINEALVEIFKRGEKDKPSYTTTTDPEGAYKIQVESGSYNVHATAFHVTTPTTPLTVGDSSLVHDFDLDIGFYLDALDAKASSRLSEFTEGEVVLLRICAEGKNAPKKKNWQSDYVFKWQIDAGSLIERSKQQNTNTVHLDTTGLRGIYNPAVTVKEMGSASITLPTSVTVLPRPLQRVDNVPVTMRRTATAPTEDLALWVLIRKSGETISFENYSHFMDKVFCDRDAGLQAVREGTGYMPYSDLYAYRLLKAATEAFLMVHCGIANLKFVDTDLDTVMRRVGVGDISLDQLWTAYLKPLVNGGANDTTIPYLALIREKLSDVRLVKTWPKNQRNPQTFRKRVMAC